MEEKFKRGFEASPDPVFFLDEEGIFVDVNESALQKLGFEEDEIVGSSLWDASFLPEDSREKITKNFERRKRGENIPPYTISLMAKQGEKYLVEVNVGAFGEKEDFTGEVIIARDIGERRRMEKTILNATRAMISSICTEELQKVIVENARKISGAKFVTLSSYQKKGGKLELEAFSCDEFEPVNKVKGILDTQSLLNPEFPVSEAPRFKKFSERKEREALFLDGFSEFTFGLFDDITCRLIEKVAGVEEIVAVPLLNGDDELIGVLGYLFPTKKENRNTNILLIFADFASQAIGAYKRLEGEK